MLTIQKVLYKLYMNIWQPFQIRSYQELVKRQNLSLKELEKLQLDKLNKLLNYSYHNVPFYQKVLDASGCVSKGRVVVDDLDQLKNIPLLSKDIIREQGDQLYAFKHEERHSYRNSSGGTTGEPVIFMQDKYYSDKARANFLLGKKWQGLSPYDSEIVLWGAERDTFSGKKPFTSIVKDFITNRVLLNCFVMSEDDMLNYVQIINSNKATVLRGYAEQLHEFAKFIKRGKVAVKKLIAVHSTAGNLKHFMREDIESTFHCKAYNYYGSREVGAIASECSEHNGLHLFMDHNIVEIVNEEGKVCKQGEVGEIVVTNLNNFSMPLIRYKIGDMGILASSKDCPCGCNYPQLERIVGRTSDLFITKKGTIVDSDFITPLFYFKNWIKKFQIIQKAFDHIMVKIVKQGEYKQGELDDLSDKFKQVMGKDCIVEFKFVPKIAKTGTGKIRYTICEVEKS